MELIIYSTVTGVFIMLSFILGLHYGQKIQRGEKIEKPVLNPVKAIKEHIETAEEIKKQKEEEKELQEFINAFENYDPRKVVTK